MHDDLPPPNKTTGETRLPGDPTVAEMIARIVRVDQAGEYGAKRIYEGQLAVLGKTPAGETIRHMADQEAAHLRDFDAMLNDRRVRPTALQPLWHLAGFALGAGTALMGERAAMACTVAVEEAIDEHYAAQAAYLGEDEKDLRDLIVAARADEIDHRDTAIEAGAERAALYEPMRRAIKSGTKLAIWLSERV
jgi:ubiquinone biosynthesis monooxygenase Coq7